MRTIDLHIKNMVCQRCIWVVKKVLLSLGAYVCDIGLGYAKVEVPNNFSLKKVDEEFRQYGINLIDHHEKVIVEKIKIAMIRYLSLLEADKMKLNLVEFIAKEVGKNGNYLSRIFSKHCHLTMENYFIMLKIEKVKELLDDGDLNLSQIAVTLKYSSVHYLSNQFKKVTGVTVSGYKSKNFSRIPIDQIKADYDKEIILI